MNIVANVNIDWKFAIGVGVGIAVVALAIKADSKDAGLVLAKFAKTEKEGRLDGR